MSLLGYVSGDVGSFDPTMQFRRVPALRKQLYLWQLLLMRQINWDVGGTPESTSQGCVSLSTKLPSQRGSISIHFAEMCQTKEFIVATLTLMTR